jgi:glycosyltransferase involved in cell wall biosynthesis
LRHKLIHITGDIHFAAIGLGRRPTVLTIHDLGMLDEGNALARWVKKKFWLDWPLLSCDRLIAVSQRTKDDILDRTLYPSDRISVIPSVISPTFRPRESEPDNAVPRILHIGLAENKNLDRHAQALAGMDVHLRIIGEPSMEQHATLKNHGVRYSHASKLSEEGVPVVTSRRAPMDQTAGGGALLADPMDVADIRLAVNRVLGNVELRRELITIGRANAEQCSAAASALKHAVLYSELLGTD